MKPMSRTLEKVVAQIVCAALLLASFAPSLAQVLSAGSHDGWTEVCSLSGAKWVQAVDDGAPSLPLKSGTHPAHCPFCATNANVYALPSAMRLAVPPSTGTAVEPPLFQLAPRPLFAWAPSQPRAPPRFS